MNRNVFRRRAPFIVLLVLGLAVSGVICVGLGAVKIHFPVVWQIIFAKLLGGSIEGIKGINGATEAIIWDIRLPRVILSGIVGAGLSVSGVAMQAFTKNPLSDPYILGVSSGASAGAVGVVVLGLFKFSGTYALAFGAFCGALLSLALVYSLAKGRSGITPTRMILTGVAVSSMFAALTNLIIYNSKDEGNIKNAMYWMMGSLSGAKWEYIPPALAVLLVVTMIMMALSRALDSMLLGEQTAIILGVNINTVRKVLIVASALLSGAIVSVSGSINFVGLIIPHVVRNIFGSEHRIVVPVSLLLGAIFLIWADAAARLIAAPQELPIGIVTSLCGAPFFLWLIRKKEYSFGG